MHRFFKIMKLKYPLTVSSHNYISRTVTEDAREQNLTGNTCVTVLRLVIVGGDIRKASKQKNVQVVAQLHKAWMYTVDKVLQTNITD